MCHTYSRGNEGSEVKTLHPVKTMVRIPAQTPPRSYVKILDTMQKQDGLSVADLAQPTVKI